MKKIALRVGEIERFVEVERGGDFVDASRSEIASGSRFRSRVARVGEITALSPLEDGRVFVASAPCEELGELAAVEVEA